MHDDVTRPKGSTVVVVTLKSKMAAGSASSGGNSKSAASVIYLKAQTNRPSRYSTAQPHTNTCQHYCHLNFPLRRKSDAILNSCVTATTTMHVRAAKALFYVIMHKVYLSMR